jgi:ribose transport system substrate-binding protein
VQVSEIWRIAFAPKFKFLGKTGALSSYWLPAWQGTQQAAKDIGVDVELIVSEELCDTDPECVEPQINLIADLIERGDIDGLVIAPFDSNRLAPVVDRAIAAGIPTIAMDTAVNSDRILTFVVFDNFTAGCIAGEWVVNQLAGTGKALILEGPSDQQNALDRRNGFLAGLHTGDIDVLDTQSADWEIEPAKQITRDWLQKYSEIDAILAANDNMALGAAQAIAEVGRQNILITGFDATEAGIAAITSGQVSATIDQAPAKQSRLALELVIRHLATGHFFRSRETSEK